MKLIAVAVVLCAALYATNAIKLISSSSRSMPRRGSHVFRQLFKRQAYDPYCDRRACAIPNCGKDFVATTLQGECCERCVPWEYARSLGIPYAQAQPQNQPRPYDPYNQPQPQPQQQRAEVYIYGPDEGARVSPGQSIYFDCEVVSYQNNYVEPRWSRSGNQPLPYNAQSTVLPGNRKLARLTIQGATQSDVGRYECSAGTGNPNEQATIDLQVTDGDYYPRPTPPPQPTYPQYPSYDPYNQPGYYPQPEPQPQPQPQPEPAAPADQGNDGDDNQGGDDGNDGQDAQPATPAPAPAPADAQDGGDEDGGEYPDDYTENEK